MQVEVKLPFLKQRVFRSFRRNFWPIPSPARIPENGEEQAWLEKQDFTNSAEDVYMEVLS